MKHYDKLQSFFGQGKLQLHYMGCDSFVLRLKTENVIKVLQNLEALFDFSNLDEDHELISKENKKVIGKF